MVEGWQRESVGSLFDVQLGKMLNKTAKEKTPQYPYLTNINVRWGAFDVSQLNTMFFSETEKSKFELQNGDILVCEGGEIGRCAVWDGSLTPCYYQKALHRLRSKGPILPRYFQVYMEHISGTKILTDFSSRTSIAHLTREKLIELPVLLPPLTEQRKIAEVLRTWDEAIEKLEALRAAKARLLTYQYTTIFHPGSSSNSGWPERRIGDFVNPRVEKALPSREMPLYSLTIEDGITPKTERYNRDFLVKDRDAKTYKVVHPGDIVFNPANLRWGAIARSQVCHPVVVSPIYEVLGINSNKIDPDYLNHALTCPHQIRRFATKVEGTLVERMAVKLDTFLMTKILVPDDREEQVRFSRIFNTMETEIRTLSRQKALIERQKRGLMQKLLTGEWRTAV